MISNVQGSDWKENGKKCGCHVGVITEMDISKGNDEPTTWRSCGFLSQLLKISQELRNEFFIS